MSRTLDETLLQVSESDSFFFCRAKSLSDPKMSHFLLRAGFIDAKQPLCALLVLAPGDLFLQNSLECPGSLMVITHLEMRFWVRLAQRKEAFPSYSSRVAVGTIQAIKENECREMSVCSKIIRNIETNA